MRAGVVKASRLYQRRYSLDEFLALMFLVLGIYMLRRTNSIIRRGIPVTLKVICAHNEEEECDENHTLLYEIYEGVYKGHRRRGAIGTILGFHKIGSILDGLFLPPSGDMESIILLRIWQRVSWTIILSALGFLIWQQLLPRLSL